MVKKFNKIKNINVTTSIMLLIGGAFIIIKNVKWKMMQLILIK